MVRDVVMNEGFGDDLGVQGHRELLAIDDDHGVDVAEPAAELVVDQIGTASVDWKEYNRQARVGVKDLAELPNLTGRMAALRLCMAPHVHLMSALLKISGAKWEEEICAAVMAKAEPNMRLLARTRPTSMFIQETNRLLFDTHSK